MRILDVTFFILVGTILLLILQWSYSLKRGIKNINYLREIFKSLFIIYLAMVIDYTFGLTLGYYETSANFIPFKETISMFRHDFRGASYQVFGNILMFMPFGFFIPLFYKTERTISKVISYSFVFSLTIEILQGFSGRFIDVDDLIFNTLGGILGFLCYIIIEKLMKKVVGKISEDKRISKKAMMTISFLLIIGFTFSSYNRFIQWGAMNKNVDEVLAEITELDYEVKKEVEIEDRIYVMAENKNKDILVLSYYKDGDKAIDYNSQYPLRSLVEGYDYIGDDGSFIRNEGIKFDEKENVKTIFLLGRGNEGDVVELDFGSKKVSFEIEENYIIEELDVSKEEIKLKDVKINIIKK